MTDVLDVLDDGTEIATVMRRFYPLVLEQAAADVQDQLGVDLAFNLNNPAVLQVLDTLAGQVRDVADTTRDEIRTLTGQATQEGWSPAKLASAIRDHGVTASKTRSELISITESARAYSQGSLLAYQESGVVQGTQWITTDPCPICAPLDGKVVELGGVFADGIDAPPAHPRCRCALIPVLKTVDTPPPAAEPAAPAAPEPFPDVDTADTWGRETFAQWRQGLTEGELTELNDYQGQYYRNINSQLRDGETLIEDWLKMAQDMDSALAKGTVDRDVLAYRGMDARFLPEALTPGTVFSDAAYVSTSLGTAIGDQFMRWAREEEGAQPILVDIAVPRGSHAAYMPLINDIAYYHREYELLLPRGSQFRVTRAWADEDGNQRLSVELVHET